MMNRIGILAVSVCFATCLGQSLEPSHPQPNGTYDITAYGAIGDGKTLNTEAFARTVDAARKAGGGIVVVPAGVFVTGTVELWSNITFEIRAGAVLKGSPNVRDYKLSGQKEVFSSGARDTASVGLITARGAENVAIIGPGTIDGSGTGFMRSGKLHSPVDFNPSRTRQGDKFMDSSLGSADGPVLPGDRPERLILFSNCKNILLRDIVLLDSPCWTVHLADCDGADVRGVRIHNNLLIPNSDGIHCTSSRNIHIADCDIRAGDDGVIVSGLGERRSVSENVTVTNCTITSRSAGVRVGYGESDIRNCVFHNLVIYGSNRGLGVFARDQGSISNILFSNIIIDTRFHTGHWWGKGEPIHVSAIPYPGRKPTGRITGVRFSNIQAKAETGIVVYGSPESPVRDLWFDRIGLRIIDGPLSRAYGGNFDLRPTARRDDSIFAHDIPGLYCRQVIGLRVHGFTLDWGEGLSDYFSDGIQCEDFQDAEIEGFEGRQAREGNGAAIRLENGRGITIRNCTAAAGTGTFLKVSKVADQGILANNDMARAKQAVEADTSSFIETGNRMPGK